MKTTLTLPLLAALLVIPHAAMAETKTVTAVVDFSSGEQIADQVQALSAALDGPEKVIYLDLTIKPAATGETLTYRVTETDAKTGQETAVACEAQWQRFSGDTSAFGFTFNPDYNHLLLKIWHAGAAEAPFTTAACEYGGSDPNAAEFVIRGYYAKSAISIPTAVDIELKPFTPAFPP